MKPSFDTKHNHASTCIRVHTTKSKSSLIKLFKVSGRELYSNYGYIDAFTEAYQPYGLDAELIIYQENMFLTTHVLRHWLPDMPWAAVFGPDYIDLFGREKLLSTPAYHTELLTDDVVFVQLTPDINDLWNKFDEVMEAREQAKRHLGYECFYQKKLAYDWHEHPELAGKVYRVPTFHFIEDGTPGSIIYDEGELAGKELPRSKKLSIFVVPK